MRSAVLKYFGSVISLLGLILSLGLLGVCQTSQGRIFALAGLLLALSIRLGCIGWERGSKKWYGWAGAVFAGCVLLSLLLLARAPNGHTASASQVQNRYFNDTWNFRQWAFGNLLPEVDQFLFGFQFVAIADPLFTRKQAKHLSGLMKRIYDELEGDPGFHALGSVMPEAYDELWGLPFEHGHYFLYIPAGLDRSVPHPAIIFLHGSGGNFKAYTWLLTKTANKLGCVIIAPSFGLGDWEQPKTENTVTAVLEDASRVVKLDRQQLHLMGLSNGGLGTSQCGAAFGQQFQTLIFLSPVFDSFAISAPAFATHWNQRDILIITGKEDDRVPFDYVAGTARAMRVLGIQVTMHPIERADHFMLFSHRAEVLGQIESWLQDHGVKP